MNSNELYQEIILDHYRNPKNYGKIEKADAEASDVNALCGDVVSIALKIRDDKIEDVKFSGAGCAISQAVASMITEQIKGKSLEEVRSMARDDVLNLLGGIQLGHVRIKCAILPLKVLKMAVYSYYGKKFDDEL